MTFPQFATYNPLGLGHHRSARSQGGVNSDKVTAMSFELILPFFPAGDPGPHSSIEHVSDLCINGDQSVFVERSGANDVRSMASYCLAIHLNAAIEQIARVLGRDITEQDPIQDLRLPNGSRVGAVYHAVQPRGRDV